MNHIRGPRDNGPITLAFALAGAALLVRVLSAGVPDTGDGVGHYQVARYAWKHPPVLLDAWAKPVFTLIASPFAQGGMWTLVLMNALFAVTAAWVIIRHVVTVQRAWCWAAPLLLFAAPQFAHTVMAGLTEPLFGTVAVMAVALALKDRWRLAFAFGSFLPFIRPEHVAVLPVLVLVGLWKRQWRALPWVLLGAFVYAVLSFLILGDPLKALLDDPYSGVDIYGTGPALYFVRRLGEVIGTPLIFVSLIALVSWPVLYRKDRERRAMHLKILLLALVPAVGILVIHSYAWWKGGHASLGLDRVLATGVPLLVLFNVHVLASAWRHLPMTRFMRPAFIGLLVFFSAFAYPELVNRLGLPYRPDFVQATLEEAAERVNELRAPEQRLYYSSPYLGVLCNVDPLDSSKANLTFGSGSVFGMTGPREGDIVVWDAHHSRVDGGIELDTLMHSRRLRLIATFKPAIETLILGGVPYEVDLFRCERSYRNVVLDTLFARGRSWAAMSVERSDTLRWSGDSMTVNATEFPMTFSALPLAKDPDAVQERLVVRGQVAGTFGKGELDLVFTESAQEESVRYASSPLMGGAFEVEWEVLPSSAALTNKLYLWNRSGRPVRLDGFMILRERLVQRTPLR